MQPQYCEDVKEHCPECKAMVYIRFEERCDCTIIRCRQCGTELDRLWAEDETDDQAI